MPKRSGWATNDATWLTIAVPKIFYQTFIYCSEAKARLPRRERFRKQRSRNKRNTRRQQARMIREKVMKKRTGKTAPTPPSRRMARSGRTRRVLAKWLIPDAKLPKAAYAHMFDLATMLDLLPCQVVYNPGRLVLQAQAV